MSKPKPKPRDYLDPIKEAQAVVALRESIKELDGDEDLLADMIEGETSLFEVIDRVLERIREADVMIAGIDAVVKSLTARKTRNEEARKRDRTLLEQAMMIAGVETIRRPTATLTLSYRAPSLLVTEESEIPPKWWKPGEPTLDKAGVLAALRQRAAILADEKMTPEDKAAALAEVPPVPGAELSNGAPSISIRNS